MVALLCICCGDTVRMTDCDYNSSRLDNSNGVLHQLDEGTLMSELDTQSDNILRQEWSSLLGTHVKEKG
jgi:hypothetical protein